MYIEWFYSTCNVYNECDSNIGRKTVLLTWGVFINHTSTISSCLHNLFNKNCHVFSLMMDVWLFSLYNVFVQLLELIKINLSKPMVTCFSILLVYTLHTLKQTAYFLCLYRKIMTVAHYMHKKLTITGFLFLNYN